MTICINVQSDVNVARRDTLGPAVQRQRDTKTMIRKVTTRTRRREIKNQPRQRKRGINPFNLYRIQIMKQVTMTNTNFCNLDSAMLEPNTN